MKKVLKIIIVVAAVAFVGFIIKQKFFKQSEPVFCTMETKLCLDGSYVGRVGLNCEFAACPKEDLIRVSSSRANEEIASPLLISGEARGYWFFEADFPVVLVDWDGKIIAQHYT